MGEEEGRDLRRRVGGGGMGVRGKDNLIDYGDVTQGRDTGT